MWETWRDDGVLMVMTMPMNSPHGGQNTLHISSLEEEQRWRQLREENWRYERLFQGFCVGSKNKGQGGGVEGGPT